MIGFARTELDDEGYREDQPDATHNQERFPRARKIIVGSVGQELGQYPVTRQSYVVIVTRGHLQDAEALAALVRSPAAYIGMIGSRRKTALVFDELRKAGFTDEELQRVRAPIGLPIAAETPEEIGISIVAEMIQARAKLK